MHERKIAFKMKLKGTHQTQERGYLWGSRGTRQAKGRKGTLSLFLVSYFPKHHLDWKSYNGNLCEFWEAGPQVLSVILFSVLQKCSKTRNKAAVRGGGLKVLENRKHVSGNNREPPRTRERGQGGPMASKSVEKSVSVERTRKRPLDLETIKSLVTLSRCFSREAGMEARWQGLQEKASDAQRGWP